MNRVVVARISGPSRATLVISVLVMCSLLTLHFSSSLIQPTNHLHLELSRRSFDFDSTALAWRLLRTTQFRKFDDRDLKDLRERLRSYKQIVEHNFQPDANVSSTELMEQTLRSMDEKLFPWIFGNNKNALATASSNVSAVSQLYHRFASQATDAGIVLSVGNAYVHQASMALRALQVLGNTLPVEIVYYGDGDLNADSRDKLKNAMPALLFTDAKSAVNSNMIHISGWFLKPLLLLVSRFSQVILMDFDVLWVQNPRHVFTMPGYVKTGGLVWADRNIRGGHECMRHWVLTFLDESEVSDTLKRTVYYRCNNGQSTSENLETGVVVMNKSRPLVLLALLSIVRLTTEPIKSAVRSYGDKEMFWIGFELAQVPYEIEQHNGGIGVPSSTHPDMLLGDILHNDHENRPLWIHTGVENGGLNSWHVYTHYAMEFSNASVQWESACGYGLLPISPQPLPEFVTSLITKYHQLQAAAVWPTC